VLTPEEQDELDTLMEKTASSSRALALIEDMGRSWYQAVGAGLFVVGGLLLLPVIYTIQSAVHPLSSRQWLAFAAVLLTSYGCAGWWAWGKHMIRDLERDHARMRVRRQELWEKSREP
jgi:hypothetical protein